MYEVMDFKLCSESGKKRSVLTVGKIVEFHGMILTVN